MQSQLPFTDSRSRRWLNVTTLIAFALPLATYWLTAAPSASFWDCPEYLAVAARLEVGHPPGNPLWQLISSLVASAAPAGREALAVNLSSGLWTALAMALTLRCVAIVLVLCLPGGSRGNRAPLCCVCALGATLCLAWCDSVWFSAVEAEVYAMSLMFTALTVWLMLRWIYVPRPVSGAGVRWLVLIAYITGLSLGVHQLNLLVLPALAVIYAYRRRPEHAAGYAIRCMLLAMCAVALVLAAMMPGTLKLAGYAELWCVNTLRLPYRSGTLLYIALTAAAFAAALALLQRRHPHRLPSVIAVAAALFLSGIFMIGGSATAGAICSAAAAIAAVCTRPFSLRSVRGAMWMLAMTLAGYSVYTVIPLRASAAPALNTGAPADIFSLRSYICRDQYGSTPLLYGPTPYSKPVSEERFDSDGRPDYTRLALSKGEARYSRAIPGGRFGHRSRMLSAADSALNRTLTARGGDAYVLTDYDYSTVPQPELNMWLPRITSADPADLPAFEAWVGMDKESMKKVEVSEAIDSAGNFTGKIDPATGERRRPVSWRPTYLQSARMLLSYQMGYMYMRYLLWNFSGRQNDYCSGGEADHGNFITGIAAIDNAILGPQETMPPEAGKGNPGHNVYYMLPLLLGLVGIGFSIWGGRRPRRWGTVILVLWLMTGLAIVVYLNQAPGEARERDYSFLGSYMAFVFWIGMGALGISTGAARLARRLGAARPSRAAIATATLLLGVPLLMLAENYDDHDRSGRYGARDLAANILNSLPQDAILLTDGDNLSFPLWYAQEVEGVRRDVSVLNFSYLTMPSCTAALGIPADGRKGVATTGTPADFGYGRYGLTAIPAAGDTLPLATLLQRLYSSGSPSPRLDSRYASLATAKGDTVTLDLREVASGGPWLRLPQLAALDIMATSAGRADGRPVCLLNGLPSKWRAGIERCFTPGLFAARMGGGSAIEAALRDAAQATGLRSGGCDLPAPPYYDPPTARMMRWQRASLIRSARLLSDSARHAEALHLASAAMRLWPFRAIAPDFIFISDSTMHEAAEIVRVLDTSGRALGDRRALRLADSIAGAEKRRLDAWDRYYRSLPPRLRGVTSPDTRRNVGKARTYNPSDTSRQ